MNPSILVVLITVNFAIALFSIYLAVRTVRRYLKKSIKRIRRQRNEDLRWHRDTLLAQSAAGRSPKTLAQRAGSKWVIPAPS